MGLSLRVDPVFLDGDLVDEEDESGVETEAIVALLSDARVDDNLLAVGRPNRGYWADSVIADGEEVGSSLWLLDAETPTDELARRASAFVEAAIAPLVREGRVVRVEANASISGQHVSVAPRIVLPSGSDVSLGELRVN